MGPIRPMSCRGSNSNRQRNLGATYRSSKPFNWQYLAQWYTEFTENNTAIENHTVRLYLMPPSVASQNPSLGATGARQLGETITGSLGNFSLRGVPAEIIEPGYGSLVVEVTQRGYVELSYKTFSWTINVTDTLNITQDTPSLPGEPIVGAGTTTLVLRKRAMGKRSIP